jgi:hypothetical protein
MVSTPQSSSTSSRAPGLLATAGVRRACHFSLASSLATGGAWFFFFFFFFGVSAPTACWTVLDKPLQSTPSPTNKWRRKLTTLTLFFLFNSLYSEIMRTTKDQSSTQLILQIDLLLRSTETLSLSEMLVSTPLL